MIDLVSHAPPCDLAVVRFREMEPPERILIPTSGGPNTGLCLELAIAQASTYKQDTGSDSEITVMTVVTPGLDQYAMQALHNRYREIYGYEFRSLFVENQNVLDAILNEARNHNLVIIGASEGSASPFTAGCRAETAGGAAFNSAFSASTRRSIDTLSPSAGRRSR